MTQDTSYLIIAGAVLVLAIVLFLLARTGRKPPEGPVALPVELSPVAEPDRIAETVAVPRASIGDLLEVHQVEELAQPAIPEPLGDPDDLTRLKGLGPKAAALLNGMGVVRYDQLAALGDDDVDRLDRRMGPFQGRFARDRWVEQARFLAEGDVAGFEAVFGKLG